MNIIINPSKSKWDSLTQRPYTENNSVVDSVKEIFKNVKKMETNHLLILP